jgi:hypothetical protein
MWKSDRPNAERVRNKLKLVNVVGGAHIRPIAFVTTLEIVPAYPTVLVTGAATTHFVEDERHEAVFGAVRRARVYEILDRSILDAIPENLVEKRGA